MKSNDIFILGAGGMAREVYQIYKDLKKNKLIKGFIVDIENNQIDNVYNVSVGSINSLTDNCLLIGGIGSPRRKNLIANLEAKKNKFDTLIHPSTIVGLNVKIGNGSIICANTILTCDVSIGRHTIINVNCSVHHDSKIGDYVTIGPGSNIVGRVSIGDESFIGAGVTVIPGVKIGKAVYIGAGSIVTSDIPDNFIAYGMPAKPIRKLNKQDWERLI